MISGSSSNHRFGKSGEDLAAKWYSENGYQLLARNWRCREGEIDLIATRDDAIVFCEVKSRSSAAFGMPVEAVTLSKQRRIRTLATIYLKQTATPSSFSSLIRFDVASVIGNKIEILEGVF